MNKQLEAFIITLSADGRIDIGCIIFLINRDQK